MKMQQQQGIEQLIHEASTGCEQPWIKTWLIGYPCIRQCSYGWSFRQGVMLSCWRSQLQC